MQNNEEAKHRDKVYNGSKPVLIFYTIHRFMQCFILSILDHCIRYSLSDSNIKGNRLSKSLEKVLDFKICY